ncbi:ABC transporter, putative [Bodo saltans]|uniref:ABC transporter, putative n=1 Tax=Bodo saltans TaxID=75058 RepID=A0A0S4IZR8_BODSA|nr:ABC transporter, putative [Bodo saltans]|eukprot:CUG06066.1 ABC transporter, putative [Bodo saltans]
MLIMGLGKMAFFSSWIFNYLLQVLLTTIIITLVLKVGILTQTDPSVIFCVYLFFSTSTITLSTLLSSFFSKSRITALVVPLLYFVLSIPSFALPDGTGRGVYMLLSLFSPTAFSLGTKLLFSYEINNGMGWNDVPDGTGRGVYMLLSLFSPTAFSLGTKLLFSYEINNGMGWNDVLFMLIFDTLMYLLLTLYFDEVLPSEWGTRSHPLFCCMPKCLCPPKSFDDGSEGASSHSSAYGATADPDSPKYSMTPGKGNREAVEDYPVTGQAPTVHLRRLRKEFGSDSGGAKKVAVDGFDLKLFEGQITVILGHNGAGKTTTLNMLTGMLPMTAGDCLVYGTSVRNDLRKARAEIGFCPQHNILWDQLTCMEHLRYIGRLKGVPSSQLEATGMEMLRRVDLVDKKDVFSSNLSGGQKRKLSVAIAFMGGSRLILLDEPTAGMDASARRHTWDLLKEMSVGRTIVLTTHFMDEADLLGNRIAIMSKGAMHSYGSSMFLKSKLGTGYAMRLSLNRIADDALAHQLVALVQQIIPTARIKEYKGQEVAITLPTHEQHLFSTAIEKMESDETTQRYGIQGISMSVASLEDVFVRIAYEEEMLGNHEVEEEEVVAAAVSSRQTSASNRNSRTNRQLSEELIIAGQHQTAVVPVNKEGPSRVPAAPGTTAAAAAAAAVNESVHEDPEVAAAFAALDTFYAAMASKRANSNGSRDAGGFSAQFSGLMLKRFHNSKRDRRTMCLQVFLPLLCIVLAMLLAMLKGPSPSLLWLDSSMYGAPAQQILLTNCDQLVPGINATQSFYGSVINYGVSPRTTPANNQSYDLSQAFLSEYFNHGDAERNIGFSCNDASLLTNNANANVFFTNSSALHSFPEGVNEWFSSVARSVTSDLSIIMRVGNYPMPLTNRQTTTIDSYRTAIIGFLILIPFTFIPSTFVSWVVKERECKAKHLQFVSGVNYFTYWASNYVFDLISYLVTEILAIIVFAFFGRDEYVDSTNLPVTIMIFLLYGISAVAASYCISFLFNNHSSAQTIVMLGNFLCGFVLVITMYILKQIDSTKDIAKILVFFFRIVPAYCLGEGITALAMAPATRMLGKELSVFELDQAGWGMIYMGLETIAFSVITLAIDHPNRRQQLFFDRNAVPEPIVGEDPDVTKERDVIEKNSDPTRASTDIVRVCNLRKVYHSGSVDKVAVKNLSFGVQRGEVFGFLGTNGAGKTTTMSILTGEFLPSMGHASITGFDVVENAQEARQVIGYCPQFDALIDLLTPEEHLRLYAALRGVPPVLVDDVVEALLTACALQMYRSTRSKSLSGGNKRKLSVAISLIGGPRVVFLDEPSAGMDPHARRQLWDVILYIAQRSSVVLTTHHLEEVDVLAHRVGIMVDGALKCIGSLDYLKHRFGNGFEVAVKLKAAATDAEVAHSARQVERLLTSEFPGTGIVEERQQKVTFCVPFHGTKLSRVFQVLADAKNNTAQFSMDDYTVQQTSLEQVFLRISDEAAAANESSSSAAASGGAPSAAVVGVPISNSNRTTTTSSGKGDSASNRNLAAAGNDSFSRMRQDSSAFYVPPPQQQAASNSVA